MDLDPTQPASLPAPAAVAPSGADALRPDVVRLSPSLAAVQEEAPEAPAALAAQAPASASTIAPPSDVTMASEAAAAAATLASVANSAAATTSQPAVVPSPVPAVPNPLPPGYNKDQPICANCSTQTTPLWRRSHDSTHILCNACALFFKMKGRPRPISLKTDVIKSRNRSKGKSTSKDRAGPGAKKPDRGESASRARDAERTARKSVPGGAGSELEEDELDDGSHAAGKEPKVRRVAPPGYPGWVSAGAYGPYPHPPHPHQHQPYPPPRARSRSSSSTRRAPSLEGRVPPAAAAPYPYPPPPPGAYHMSPEGYPYFYPGQYPGYPPAGPYFAPPGPAFNHAAAAAAAAHALTHPPAPITHAQSDSRSGSKTDSAQASEANDSPRSSASPPLAATHPAPPPGYPQYYPHPNPNYPHHPGHLPYSQSPLNPAASTSATTAPKGVAASGSSTVHTTEQANGRVTLAPMVHLGGTSSRASTPGAPDERVVLPSITSVSSSVPGQPRSTSTSSAVPSRHTGLFSARAGTTAESSTTLNPNDRVRRTSVSSNSASISGSSDGVRSPEASARSVLPWGAPGWLSPEDERRGRPEKRFEDSHVELDPAKEAEEIDELAEDDVAQQHHHHRMDGVEAGLGELRVVDQYGSTAQPDSSRSRSSGNERGRNDRPRGGHQTSALRGRSQSTSRARGIDRSSSISSGRPSALAIAEAEIARLKTKVSELTFLNSLMQSRLGQLEGPGRVPSAPMSGLIAPTPAPMHLPDPDDEEDDDDDAMQGEPAAPDDELTRYMDKVTDPTVRANLLGFFRSQQVAGSA